MSAYRIALVVCGACLVLIHVIGSIWAVVDWWRMSRRKPPSEKE